MADALAGVRALVLLPGSATEKLVARMSSSATLVDTMHDAVAAALDVARAGDAVVLSPGAASFGTFANEFDRGRQFVDGVHGLASGRRGSRRGSSYLSGKIR